jgi:hypothetical protein
MARSRAPEQPEPMTTSSSVSGDVGVPMYAAIARRASTVPAEWMYPLCRLELHTW